MPDNENETVTAAFSFSPTEPTAGEPVTFDATASKATNGTITDYEWLFGDGTTANGSTPTHSYSTAGNYTVTLRVTDDSGGNDTVTQVVAVANATNSVPTASFTVEPQDPATTGVTLGETVVFNASGSSDPDGDALTYEWSFGTGASATGRTTSTSYGSVGTYTVTLTVTDPAGASNQSVARVPVADPDPLPGEVVFAVNAGGDAYTTAGGLTYRADTGFTGGNSFTVGTSIAGTDSDPLYQSDRFGNFTYSVPVVDGEYEVTLLLAEIFWNESGKRVFDVTIEGEEVISDLDIYAVAGADTAYDVDRTVNVTDGTLDIEFGTDVNQAKLNALRVAVAADPVAPLPEAGSGLPPNDPDGDGLVEDVDGNGAVEFADVIALAFVDGDSLTTRQRVAVDFDGDGDFDFADVIELAFGL